MYIRFDIEDHFDLAAVKTAVMRWANKYNLEYTQKVVWNKKQQHFRVCLPQPSDYSLFAMTWPESGAKFTFVEP